MIYFVQVKRALLDTKRRFLPRVFLTSKQNPPGKKNFFHFQISILLFWLLYSKGNYCFKTDHLKLCICACVCVHICWLGGWLIGWRDLLLKKGLQHISNIWFVLLEESQYISNFLLMITVDRRIWGNNTFWFQLVIGRESLFDLCEG